MISKRGESSSSFRMRAFLTVAAAAAASRDYQHCCQIPLSARVLLFHLQIEMEKLHASHRSREICTLWIPIDFYKNLFAFLRWISFFFLLFFLFKYQFHGHSTVAFFSTCLMVAVISAVVAAVIININIVFIQFQSQISANR